MSGQREQSAVPADHRSAHPKYPGVPWWGAVLLAVTATAIGFAFDAGSGNRELSGVFGFCYVMGCLLAVLAVRQTGVFTAVIQPPLILFAAVPGSYFLFHGGQLAGIKDLAINCGYPLIERFPLMLFTSAAVLLIGLARWYFGLATRDTSKADTDTPEPALAGFVAVVTSKVSGLLFRKPATARSARSARSAEPDPTAEPRRRPADRPARRKPATADAAARAERRPTTRTAASRSRTHRPPETEFGDPVAERPRRPRTPRPSEPPLVPPAAPRRRVRNQPREPGRTPPADRRAATSYDRDRPQQRRRFDDYQPFEESFEPAPRSGRSTHHPVSRVRYRGEDEDSRTEHRARPRSSRGRDAQAWERDG